MARLPVPGGDTGNWGTILNDFLSQAHNADGSLKSGTVSPTVLADGSITKPKLSASGGTNGQVLSTDGTNLTWSTPSGGSTPNATTSSVGVIQLAGDLGGTATAPTVPGLANKADTSALSSGLAGKANTSHTHNASDVNAGTLDIARIPTGMSSTTVALGNHAHSGYEATVAAGTTSQYYRGDKSWQTLDKTAVGLSNVDNTSDANKPVSTAVATALAGKANTAHTHTTADISDFTEATQDLLNTTLVAGTNVSFNYNDPANTLTINATSGAGVTDISIARTATTVTVESNTGLDGTIAAADGSNAGILTSTDKTKLDGIATGATANATDAQLRDRSTHTGTQAQGTVTNLTTDLAAKAIDTDVVHLAGTETISGVKTFSGNPRVTAIDDSSGNTISGFTTVASAVNSLAIRNAATGNQPAIVLSGSDTNVGLNVVTKGTGLLRVNGTEVVNLSNAQTLINKTISGASNTITNVSLATGVTGNLPVTNLNSGTNASALSYWRGDGAWVDPPGVDLYFPFSMSGAIYVTTGQHRSYVESSRTITRVRASVGTAPTGSSIIIDVLKNGTSIYNVTPANRPTIAVGTNTALGGAPDTTTFVSGDYITVSVLQIGSTVSGSDLTVSIRLQ